MAEAPKRNGDVGTSSAYFLVKERSEAVVGALGKTTDRPAEQR